MMATRRSGLLLLAAYCLAPARGADMWEVTNEIEPYPKMRDLGTCRRGAVCGLVQTNAWGVHAEPFCACPGRRQCPLIWDPQDGHSVTHGSNQYKYCQQAPALSECADGQVAVTDELVTLRDDATEMAHYEVLHCRCPSGRQLKQTDSQWREMANSDVIITMKSCVEMPICEAGQHCKFISRTQTSTLVQVNCACAGRQTCPSVTERGMETQSFPSGSLQSVYCR